MLPLPPLFHASQRRGSHLAHPSSRHCLITVWCGYGCAGLMHAFTSLASRRCVRPFNPHSSYLPIPQILPGHDAATSRAHRHEHPVVQVGESVAKPMLYYNNNIVGTCNLIECMRADPTCKKVRALISPPPTHPAFSLDGEHARGRLRGCGEGCPRGSAHQMDGWLTPCALPPHPFYPRLSSPAAPRCTASRSTCPSTRTTA